MQSALARALSVEDVSQLGRDTGQSERLRTVTSHRLFLSTVTALAAQPHVDWLQRHVDR